MNEMYAEAGVKCEKTSADLAKIAIIAVAFIASVVLSMAVSPVFLVAAIGVGAFAIYKAGQFNYEYEYIFCDGQLDIDKIMHKEKRKRMFSTNVSDMEIMAPANSAELNSYKNARVYNYTSGNPEAKVYEMLIVSSGETKRLIFEPNEAIVEGIWMMAPRKVIR